jgi:hypothetical protein
MHHKNRSVAVDQLILGKFWTLISELWQVGSVFFGAIQDPLLESLKKSNYTVLDEEILARSADQQKWAYGSMVAIGSRIPKGGIRGDTYHPYDHVKAEDPDDTKMLFEHAKVPYSSNF